MASNIAKVTARKKAPSGEKKMGHKHPVRHAKIMPADNGGFNTEIENHPTDTGPEAAYAPGQVMTGAHPNLAAALKHVKGALQLKTDAQEQGEGEQSGGDPGTSPDAE